MMKVRIGATEEFAEVESGEIVGIIEMDSFGGQCEMVIMASATGKLMYLIYDKPWQNDPCPPILQFEQNQMLLPENVADLEGDPGWLESIAKSSVFEERVIFKKWPIGIATMAEGR